jgi:hypothetical protein
MHGLTTFDKGGGGGVTGSVVLSVMAAIADKKQKNILYVSKNCGTGARFSSMYEVDKGNCPSFYQAFVLSFCNSSILYCCTVSRARGSMFIF